MISGCNTFTIGGDVIGMVELVDVLLCDELFDFEGMLTVNGNGFDRIFYRKTMLACGDRKWHNLELEYPAANKSAMDRFVTRASYALSAYNGAGC
jgi:hypothetical protein